jgi:Spy/CpxP family protein refolding chaperone
MKKFLLACALCMTFGLASDALAQGHHNRGDRSGIRRGVRSGQLTRDEAQQLRQRRRQIREERRTYRSDGTYTRDERRDVRRDRRELRRDVRRERRDDDRRRGNGYYRRGAGSPSHPVFGNRNRRGRRY